MRLAELHAATRDLLRAKNLEAKVGSTASRRWLTWLSISRRIVERRGSRDRRNIND
jgi:hypothetical protein